MFMAHRIKPNKLGIVIHETNIITKPETVALGDVHTPQWISSKQHRGLDELESNGNA